MEQAQLLERVLALTQEIDEATRIADWERAASLSEQRSPLVHAITAPQPPSSLALVRRIQAIDAATLQSAQVASTELQAEYHAATQHVRAARQYQRVARF